MKKPTDFGIRMQHIGLHVFDMQATMDWYGRVFGFELLYHAPGLKGLFPRMCMLDLADFCIELYEVRNPQPFSILEYENRVGLKHLGIAVCDFEGWLEHVNAMPDVKVVSELMDRKKRSVFVLDNSGIPVEVCEDSLAADVNLKRKGKYGIRAQHTAVAVFDIEDTVRWYGERFGFKKISDVYVDRLGGSNLKKCEIDLEGFVLELYELDSPQPFSLVDYEYNVGWKHLNLDMIDRLGWTEYLETLPEATSVVVSCDHRYDPGMPLMPHYVWDNNGMLLEMSDEHLLTLNKRF